MAWNQQKIAFSSVEKEKITVIFYTGHFLSPGKTYQQLRQNSLLMV
jgi:hypothetical protein